MRDETIPEHYATGYEAERLSEGSSRIEFARTKELLTRFLPPAPADVLDVGGGPGVYALWLADEGYRVHLVDPLHLHVKQAVAAAQSSDRPFTAAVGDARSLAARDGSWDAVVMLGPLYHITERHERVQALAEATRVVRPGGVVAAAGISRFVSLLDGLESGWLGDPAFDAIVARDLREGQHRNPTKRAEWFTTAFFHHPNELLAEAQDAGLENEAVFGIEGPGWLLSDKWDDPRGREAIMQTARAVEEEPSLIGASAHLLLVAQRPARR